MTPSCPSEASRQALLEDVLSEYMQRLDRGEAVDREQFLARYPELAEGLRSYFAGSDELEHLGRQPRGGTASFPSRARPEEAPRAEDKGQRVGDYELLEQIGQGGMGVIYKARQLSLRRLVALKMVRTDRLASPVDLLRFQSEAEAVASLDHPHIVPIYEVGDHDGQPFFAMKFIDGGSLGQQLPRLAADLRASVVVLATVARAVHYAHQRGLLHRDLKPANILLDAQGQPHVTDFGLAKRLGPKRGEASLTEQGLIVGTPNYMAPEQAASKGGVSTAADVYSLGAILYELLTGQPPFRAETPLGTLLQVMEQEPAPPSSLNRHVDRDLETVCLKCLHKEVPKRYASAEALAQDLERWQRGEPVRARPVGRRERALKWVRRRPHLAALAALLVLALAAGFAGVGWQGRRAANEAEAQRQTAYARAIPLAYAEWLAGNAGTAERVLKECHSDLSGWEWHYLRRQFGVRQLATLEGRGEGVLAVAFSPDGARVAAAGADGVVDVWDRRTLQRALTLRGHASQVTAVAFSPDGKSLASGGADGTVRAWDAASGEGRAAWEGHSAEVTGLAFDPTGRRLASTGRGSDHPVGEVKLWDPAEGKALGGRAWPNLLAAVAFSPDGKSLATAGHDVVTAWDATNLEPIRTFTGHNATDIEWTRIAVSANGRWVAVGNPDGLVRVWDAASAQEVFSGHTLTQAGISGLAFCGTDGRILAAVTADHTVQGWHTRSGKPAFTLRGHQRPVTAVASSPDGRCLATASLDRTMKLWDIESRFENLTLRGTKTADAGARGVAFSPDGARLASAHQDRALKVWDLATGKEVLTLRLLPGALNGLAVSPGGGELAAAGADGAVRVWELPSGRERLRLGGGAPAHAVAFSPGGGELAAAGADGAVRVWELPSGRERLRLGGGAPAHAVAFSPDGRRLAAAGDDGISRVWDAATGRELLALGGDGGSVYAVAFSPDGQRLAAAGQDETVRVWDAATGALVLTLRGHAGAVRGLAYGPSGRLASVGDDKTVRLWNAAGQELLALRGHAEPLRAVAFSRDGHRLASAGDGGTITIWDGTPLDGALGERQPSVGAR